METYLTELSWFALLLLTGIISTLIAQKLRLPEVLLLIIIGLIIGNLKFNIQELIPYNILAVLILFALIMIVFESSSKFKIREIQKLYPHALKLTVIFIFSNLILLTIFTQLLFADQILEMKSIFLSMFFSALMCGTDPSVMLSVLKESKNKLIEILKIESIINTPTTVLIPILILNFYFGKVEAASFVIKFLQQIITGVGAGLVIGYIVIKILNKLKIEFGSALLIIGIAVGTYTLTEQIGGSGILAITAFGLIYGHSKVKEKVAMQKFGDIFTEFLTILVFILLGMVIKIPLTPSFILKTLLLFGIYLLIRHLAINITFKKSKLTDKEKLFMSLNVPKGITVAVVVFILISYKNPSLEIIQSLALTFILYSIILSSIVSKFGNHFLRLEETSKTTLKKLKTKKVISSP